MSKVLYMACTLDEYELPIAVADSYKELAKIMHTTTGSILSTISHKQNKGSKSRYRKVIIEEEAATC